MAKKKHILDYEFELDLAAIGIVSHQKHYKLCWAINKQLDWHLERVEDLFFKSSTKQKKEDQLCKGQFIDELTGCEYSIVENKKEKTILLPEHKQADYLLLINGPYDQELINKIIFQLKQISLILLVYRIEDETIINKQNLTIFL